MPTGRPRRTSVLSRCAVRRPSSLPWPPFQERRRTPRPAVGRASVILHLCTGNHAPGFRASPMGVSPRACVGDRSASDRARGRGPSARLHEGNAHGPLGTCRAAVAGLGPVPTHGTAHGVVAVTLAPWRRPALKPPSRTAFHHQRFSRYQRTVRSRPSCRSNAGRHPSSLHTRLESMA